MKLARDDATCQGRKMRTYTARTRAERKRRRGGKLFLRFHLSFPKRERKCEVKYTRYFPERTNERTSAVVAVLELVFHVEAVETAAIPQKSFNLSSFSFRREESKEIVHTMRYVARKKHHDAVKVIYFFFCQPCEGDAMLACAVYRLWFAELALLGKKVS